LSPKTIEKEGFKLYSQKARRGGVVLLESEASGARTKSGRDASKPQLFLDLGFGNDSDK
jgi:hypothetical protein